MSSFCGSDNDENDYEIGCREERARIVAWIREAVANAREMLGGSTQYHDGMADAADAIEAMQDPEKP